jgi:hypothetical protein
MERSEHRQDVFMERSELQRSMERKAKIIITFLIKK